MSTRRVCPQCGYEYHWRCSECRRTLPTTRWQNPLPKRAWLVGGFLVLGLFVCCACWPTLVKPPDVYHAVGCKYNLKQLGLALHNYHDAYGTFPPAWIADEDGRPMHSWRVLLLPYLDQQDLYDEYRFDEPWDGPNNRLLHDRLDRWSVYHCPSDRGQTSEMTSYVAVVGDGTAWPGAKSVSMADVADGLTNTIFLVEVQNSGIHWMEPRDLELDTMSLTVNDPDPGVPAIRSAHFRDRGFWRKPVRYVHVLMGDGTVVRLSAATNSQAIQELLTIDGGETVKIPPLD